MAGYAEVDGDRRSKTLLGNSQDRGASWGRTNAFLIAT